jgi:hypothetical protein
MDRMALLIRIAGLVQLLILAANVALPRRLALDDQLPRLAPIVRQMLLVHWGYILYAVLFFASLCLAFPADLAGASALGRALSTGLALFWLPRAVLQVAYYDRGFTRRHRIGHLLFVAAFVYLGGVFALAAAGAGR